MDLGTTKESALQITVKAVNNIAGPDGLVPTLLASDAYPQISELNLPPPSTTQQATAIQWVIEVSKIGTMRQLNGVLNQRNGLSVTTIHNLPLNLDVLVRRKGNTRQSGKWTSLFQLLGINGETHRVQPPSGPTRS